ncbi:hypothetical protein UT300002_26640 [Clostridium perfringens]
MREKRKQKTKLSALFLALAMILSLFTGSISVFAEEAGDHKITGTEAQPATINLKKTLIADKGVNLPDLTFNFTATKKSVNDIAVADPQNDNTMPSITFNGVEFSNQKDINDTNFNVQDKVYKITKEQNVNLTGFTHAGKYEWTIEETNTNEQNVIYDTNSYTLTAYVANNAAGNGYYVKTITIKNANDKKVENLEFVNRYVKNNGSLIISKSLADSNKADTGTDKHTENFNDKSKDFSFTINLTKPASADKSLTKVIAKYYKQDGQTEDKEINFGQDQSFTLKDGERLEFDKNLPIGTTYTVKENAVENYTPSAKVTQNGTVLTFDTKQVKEGSKNTELNAAEGANKNDAAYENKLYIGEGENKVEFTNTYDFIVLTGIIMNNLPFILMVVVAALGFGIYAIAKGRRYSH